MIALMLPFLVSQTQATELLIGVHTRHYDGGEYWEHNQLLGIKTDRLIVAQFENSYRRPGAYVGLYTETQGAWHIGATPGVMSSYCPSYAGMPCFGGWTIGGMLYGGYQADTWSARVFVGHAILITVGIPLK